MSITVHSHDDQVDVVLGCDATMEDCDEHRTIILTGDDYPGMDRWTLITEAIQAMSGDAEEAGWSLGTAFGQDYCSDHVMDRPGHYSDWRHEGCVCQQPTPAPQPKQRPLRNAVDYVESILRALHGDR